MADREETPHLPAARDIGAVIGLLAALEGAIWAEESTDDGLPDWATGLGSRLASDLDIVRGDRSSDVRQALFDLNQRLRYVLGEMDGPGHHDTPPPRDQ